MDSLFDVDEIQKKNDNIFRIRELEKLIAKYQASYYNGEAEISDAEFDSLWDELKALDSENPILKKVGADSVNFKKANHVMPMGSQEKASNPEQFLSWAKKHSYDEYFVEYKLDGASLELQFEKGKLIRAVTRGDGSVGDEITKNAVKMEGVVTEIAGFTGGVRGEVIMKHSVHKGKYSDKANCRNAANGLMKRKDGSGSEDLTLITYDALSTDGKVFFSDEEEKIAWLKKSGFNVVPLEICHSADEVIDYRARVMEKRKDLEYDIDGLVIKERKIDLQDASRARPDRQIAFKFSLEEAVSTLRDIEWSENGATYTPVAVFDEVELNGTRVTHASLANPDTMRDLSLKIGCRVVVVKRGEIIPKIESAFSENPGEEKEIVFPKTCSCCGSALVDEGSRLFCPERSCPKRFHHQISKWIACADIRDLGETLLQNLFEKKVVRSISDLYTLTEENLTPFFLNSESIEKEKVSLGAKKVIASIQSHRNLSLSSFIAGFDIEGFGETTVEKLVAEGYDTLEKILSLSKEDISSVYGFAEKSASDLVQGLSENREEMLSLSSSVISIKQTSGGVLKGLSFCFTGELVKMKRQDAEKIVKDAGGSCKSSVTKDLSYLVTNDTESGSSKNVKAKSLGIKIITEEEFYRLAGK